MNRAAAPARRFVWPRAALLHRIAGWATVGAFLGTGMFMRFGYHGVAPPDLAHRVFFRTHHLYLLAASLVQLLVASQLAGTRQPQVHPRLRAAASTLLLAAPPLLLLGFASEHLTAALRGPATSLGWFTLLGGVLLHLLSMRP